MNKNVSFWKTMPFVGLAVVVGIIALFLISGKPIGWNHFIFAISFLVILSIFFLIVREVVQIKPRIFSIILIASIIFIMTALSLSLFDIIIWEAPIGLLEISNAIIMIGILLFVLYRLSRKRIS